MSAITLADYTVLNLRLDMNAYEQILKTWGTWEAMQKKREPHAGEETEDGTHVRLTDQEQADRMNTNIALAVILANAAAVYDQRPERYTREWLCARLQMPQMTVLNIAIRMAIADFFRMETEEKRKQREAEEHKTVDLIMEMLKKNELPRA